MAATTSRRPLLIVLGATVLTAGLVAAAVMWTVGGDRRRSAVENFARAPVGCDTTLDFDETGAYTVFVETSGRATVENGDCDVDGSYSASGDRVPDVQIEIRDPDGDDITEDLEDADGDLDYDVDVDGTDFVGVSLFTIDIEQSNDHVFRVAADDTEDTFVVAVGRDPDDGVALWRAGAVAAGVAGLVMGLVLVLLGARRRSGAPDHSAAVAPPGPASWQPAGHMPPGPPMYGRQAGPPPFVSGPPPPPPVPPPPIVGSRRAAADPPTGYGGSPPPHPADPQPGGWYDRPPSAPPGVPVDMAGEPTWTTPSEHAAPPNDSHWTPNTPADGVTPIDWSPSRDVRPRADGEETGADDDDEITRQRRSWQDPPN